jgi:predicted DCC family thiol-disulfide oxidoreductase YuxK
MREEAKSNRTLLSPLIPHPSSLFTNPPGEYVLLYDGSCQFCTAQSRNLVALARRGVIDAVDFQQPGVLARFPGISHEACMQAMHLVTPEGLIYKGFEAAVRAVATRPILGWIAYAYYVPGFRQIIDRLYAFIARRRYRFFGRSAASSPGEAGWAGPRTLATGDGRQNGQECQSGTCHFHRW